MTKLHLPSSVISPTSVQPVRHGRNLRDLCPPARFSRTSPLSSTLSTLSDFSLVAPSRELQFSFFLFCAFLILFSTPFFFSFQPEFLREYSFFFLFTRISTGSILVCS